MIPSLFKKYFVRNELCFMHAGASLSAMVFSSSNRILSYPRPQITSDSLCVVLLYGQNTVKTCPYFLFVNFPSLGDQNNEQYYLCRPERAREGTEEYDISKQKLPLLAFVLKKDLL